MAVEDTAGQGAAAYTTTFDPITAGSGHHDTTTDSAAGSSGMTRSGSVYRRLSGAAVASETQHSTATVADEQPCCRICLETATEEEFGDSKALRLGCRWGRHVDKHTCLIVEPCMVRACVHTEWWCRTWHNIKLLP